MEKRNNQTIFVLYQDETTRAAAMSFCDDMVQRFWTECSFDISWCSFRDLMQTGDKGKVLPDASGAKMIIVAVEPDTWVPAEVRGWAESVARERADREGAIVGLLDPVSKADGYTNAYTWARRFAHMAGLDYLTQAPASLTSQKHSIASCTERATAMTSVLDDILKNHPLPALHRSPQGRD